MNVKGMNKALNMNAEEFGQGISWTLWKSVDLLIQLNYMDS